MPNYLLDTNCFYSFSRKVIDLNKLREDNSNILACPLNVLEIARSKDDIKDFRLRKQAMINLRDIANIYISKSTDYIFDKAFGLESQEDNIVFNSDDIINCMINANSYAEAKNGIDVNGKTVRIDFDALHEWKLNLSVYFSSTMTSDDIAILEKIKEYLPTNKQTTEREIKRSSKRRFREIADMDIAYVLMVVGLGVRVNLYSDDEYDNAVNSEDVEKFNEMIEIAISKYNFLLDSYIKIYLEYRKERLHNSPDKNDFFDLDFFTYLDFIGDCVFVTDEPKWVELANRVNCYKIISKDNFFNEFRIDNIK